jgi:hypothetical protein
MPVRASIQNEREKPDMPYFDGTGPWGLGPLTGNGQGFCIEKIPDSAGQLKTGFAGFQGWPFHYYPGTARERADRRLRLHTIQQQIHRLAQRLFALETRVNEPGCNLFPTE